MSAVGEPSASRAPTFARPARGPRRPPLTGAEEIALAKRIEQGDLAAKHEMTVRNLGLVYVLAKRCRSCGVAFDDLIQEGTLGLMRAVEGFDHRRGVRFSTYAAWWIRSSLLDAVGADQSIRIPGHAARQLAAVRRAEQDLEGAGVRLASTADVAERSGLSASSVQALRTAPRVTASLDEPVGELARPLIEAIADPQGVEPDGGIVRDELRREVWRLLRLLPERHRHVLIRRYGIGGGRAQSHREIGERLGVREERSRQLEREALHRLRELPTSRRNVA